MNDRFCGVSLFHRFSIEDSHRRSLGIDKKKYTLFSFNRKSRNTLSHGELKWISYNTFIQDIHTIHEIAVSLQNTFYNELLNSIMKRITDRHEPDEEKYIHTEGIDYFKTGKDSVWGPGDKDTLELLRKSDIHGTWLNLTAGDGRYNVDLLKRADFDVASDLDESALSKLWHNTPKGYRPTLTIAVFDVTRRFPFEDGSFDGVYIRKSEPLYQYEESVSFMR